MRRLFVALVMAGSLVAISVAPTTAITKTYVRDFDHPYVGLIAFYNTDPVTGQLAFSHRCTGELLSSTVVLTAGHCTDNEAGGVNEFARIWFQQDAGVNFDPATEQDLVTGYPNYCAAGTLGTLCAESDLMFNYGFNNFAGFPNIHDIGIVILNQPITGLGHATLAPDATLDALIKARGTQDTTFTVSGYGLSFSAKQGTVGISFRERLMAQEKLVNLVSSNTDGYSIQLNGNGDSRGGTCSGDSGGPVFYPADSDQIVAVTSWGMSNAGCRGDGWYYRTDRQEVLDWIDGVVGG
jgi:secreted trypsin-like serine protease